MNYESLNKISRISTELNKIKITLLAIWDNQNHPEAQELIDGFRKDIHNLEGGIK